jgi:DNA polymerase III gamma/tau subunit
MKEVAASIESEKIQTASIASLNKEVSAIVTSLTEDTIKALLKSNYIDEEHNLTRSGYKALIKTVTSES